jgi:hypothetical protein
MAHAPLVLGKRLELLLMNDGPWIDVELRKLGHIAFEKVGEFLLKGAVAKRIDAIEIIGAYIIASAVLILDIEHVAPNLNECVP